jgi:hypothetical protein
MSVQSRRASAGRVRVRYLLAKAPEITDGDLECYAPEARDFNRALLDHVYGRPGLCATRPEKKAPSSVRHPRYQPISNRTSC